MKHCDEKQLGKERVSFTHISIYQIIKNSENRNSSKAGTRRQELMQKLWRGAAYWLAQPAFL